MSPRNFLSGLRKLPRYSLKDQMEIFRLAAGLNLAHMRLKFLPHRFNRAWLEGDGATFSPPAAADLQKARRLQRLLSLAARAAVRDATCLRRSLVLRDRLISQGLPCRLVYGVRKGEDGKVFAHAWVDLGGVNMDTYGTAQGYQVVEKSGKRAGA